MPDDLSTLINDLASTDDSKRLAAVEALARHADARSAAVPLTRATGDANETIREAAVSALEDMGPPATGDLTAIAELLSNTQGDIAYWAATLLGRCQADAAAAVEPLANAMLHANTPSVRQRSAWALGQIGPAIVKVRSHLETAANDADRRLARLAGRALEQI